MFGGDGCSCMKVLKFMNIAGVGLWTVYARNWEQ